MAEDDKENDENEENNKEESTFRDTIDKYNLNKHK